MIFLLKHIVFATLTHVLRGILLNLPFKKVPVSKSKVCKTGEKKSLFGLFFSDISKNSVFICMFTWVAGSTHNVLLAMNVSLNKNSAECEESFSPSSRK